MHCAIMQSWPTRCSRKCSRKY